MIRDPVPREAVEKALEVRLGQRPPRARFPRKPFPHTHTISTNRAPNTIPRPPSQAMRLGKPTRLTTGLLLTQMLGGTGSSSAASASAPLSPPPPPPRAHPAHPSHLQFIGWYEAHGNADRPVYVQPVLIVASLADGSIEVWETGREESAGPFPPPVAGALSSRPRRASLVARVGAVGMPGQDGVAPPPSLANPARAGARAANADPRCRLTWRSVRVGETLRGLGSRDLHVTACADDGGATREWCAAAGLEQAEDGTLPADPPLPQVVRRGSVAGAT